MLQIDSVVVILLGCSSFMLLIDQIELFVLTSRSL